MGISYLPTQNPRPNCPTPWDVFGYGIASGESGVEDATYPIADVRRYGAVGDGSTDDTAAIQAAVTAAGTNGRVFFPSPSSYYKCTGLITIAHDGQEWVGEGRTNIQWTTLGAFTLGAFGAGTAGVLVNANNATFRGLDLQGPHAASYVANAAMIAMVGTSTSVRKTGLTIVGCEISEVGAYGVVTMFVDDIRLEGNYLHNCGFGGAVFFSSNTGRVYANRFETFTPGASSDPVGISLSHYTVGYNVAAGAGTKDTANPFCWDWDVAFNSVVGVQGSAIATGIDAHGGYEVTFRANKVYACSRAIQLASSSGDAANYAGWNNAVLDNLCDASDEDGTTSSVENDAVGIECSGGSTVLQDRLLVSGNIIRYYGPKDTAEGAAIRAHYCRNSRFSNNIITQWGGVGLNVDAVDNEVDGNHIGALADATDSVAYAVETSTSGTGNIAVTNNVVRASTGTAARIGFYFANLTTRPVITGNDFLAATVGQLTEPSNGFARGADYPNVLVVTNDATTQSVANLTPGTVGTVVFEYTTPVSVTNLTNARKGQIVTLVVNNANAVTFTRANATLAGGANWVGGQDDTLTLLYVDGAAPWKEIARSANS